MVEVFSGADAPVVCPSKSFNLLIYFSNCAKYQLRLFISSPFAIFSRNVVAFLDIYNPYFIMVVFPADFPSVTKLFPCVT